MLKKIVRISWLIVLLKAVPFIALKSRVARDSSANVIIRPVNYGVTHAHNVLLTSCTMIPLNWLLVPSFANLSRLVTQKEAEKVR